MCLIWLYGKLPDPKLPDEALKGENSSENDSPAELGNGAYPICMDIMCTSAGSSSFTSARPETYIGPYTSPRNAVAKQFSMNELTNQIVSCRMRERTTRVYG